MLHRQRACACQKRKKPDSAINHSDFIKTHFLNFLHRVKLIRHRQHFILPLQSSYVHLQTYIYKPLRLMPFIADTQPR